MLTDFIASIEQLIPMLKEKRQAQELALQAEIVIREFSGLPPAELRDRDPIEILTSICLLLERFQQYPKLLNPTEHPQIPPRTIVETAEIQSLVTPQIGKPAAAQLSITAKESISLRDWVLLANSNKGEDQSDSVLDTIAEKLGKILELEGLTLLQQTGVFNYERQKIVGTQVTDDVSKDNLIYATVRPGYLFNDTLIRPQEVVIYSYNTANQPDIDNFSN